MSTSEAARVTGRDAVKLRLFLYDGWWWRWESDGLFHAFDRD
jgi:hypothetical protein